MFVKYRINRRNKQLLSALPFPNSGNLLDVSHGDGSFLNSLSKLHPDLKLQGIDLSLPEQNYPRIKFQIANATQLPFEQESFDVIVCSMSLHHYNNLDKVLSEISKVAETSSLIYITDIMPSNTFYQMLYNFIGCSSPYYFGQYYTEQQLISLAKKYNLKFVNDFRIAWLPRVKTLQFTK